MNLALLFLVFVVRGLPPPPNGRIVLLDPIAESRRIKIAFGSCFGRSGRENDIFDSVLRYSPHLWAWIGDFTYADRRILPTIWVASSMREAEAMYNFTKQNRAYRGFEAKHTVVGVWDDHDYGCNNGDKRFEKKAEMKQMFLDYIGEPMGTERRLNRSGVYADYEVSLAGELGVRMILLDVRYNSDPDSGDVLGEEQWAWLDRVLGETKDDLYLIASGIQILPVDGMPFFEHWSSSSRARLLSTIRRHSKSGIVLLSGDVHFAQLYRSFDDPAGIGYPLYELCSSGMTHTCATDVPFCSTFLRHLAPSSYAVTQPFDGLNFGTVEIYPGERKSDSVIKFQVRNYDGKVVQEYELTYGELEFAQKPQATMMMFNRTTLHFVHNLIDKVIVQRDTVGYFSLLGLVFAAAIILAPAVHVAIKVFASCCLFPRVTRLALGTHRSSA